MFCSTGSTWASDSVRLHRDESEGQHAGGDRRYGTEQTWLVLTAATLFGTFSRAHAALLSAFYLPMIFLLGP